MSSTHKIITLITAGLLALSLIVVGVIFTVNNSQDANPNVNKVSGEELVEAERARQASFALIDEDAILVSHVNTKALTTEALQDWWQWYIKMLPPEFATVTDISDIDYLESVTLAVVPTKNSEYAAGTPLYYSIMFTTDLDNEQNLISSIQEKNRNANGSFLKFHTQGNDKSVVTLTSIQGLEDMETIIDGNRDSFTPNDDWFPVDAEPTMYVNASGYLGTMLDSNINADNDSFTDVSREIMTNAFGFTDETGFTWLGRSTDFGTTWVSDEVSDIAGINPAQVSHETLAKMQSDAIQQVMDESTLMEHEGDGVDTAFGMTDSLGMLTVLEAISVRTGNGNVIGSVLDPYTEDAEMHEAPEANDTEGFSVVFSPIMWQSTFQGMITPSYVKTVTAQVDADGESSLVFKFYEEGDEGYPIVIDE